MSNRPDGLRTALAFVPWWAWGLVVVVALCGVVLMGAVFPTAAQSGSSAADLQCQCASAIGDDPSETPTATTTASKCGGGGTVVASDVPSTNPYASVTVDPGDNDVSDWIRSCLSGPMQSAPYQLPELAFGNTGFAGSCAGALAASYRSEAADMAELVRGVIYQASVAATTQRCEKTSLDGIPAPTGNGCQTSTDAIRGSNSGAVILPTTLAGQAICGQRVQLSAASAGDVVFWDYGSRGPARAGVVLGNGTMVTADATTGRLVEQTIPTSRGVQVKRVLGAGA
ncbi:NlpC/P60 family protein [Nocardia nova]|uniref:NlpC/P60 family protein n=1 Tax=Nocardia nova TaxID=37330 RepID=UPI0011AFDE6B|nr:NlpC/P60 family protein [Nocardia nova]